MKTSSPLTNDNVCGPYCPCRHWPQHTTRYHSVAEQMGTDPQSKLAAAINRLCDLIERGAHG